MPATPVPLWAATQRSREHLLLRRQLLAMLSGVITGRFKETSSALKTQLEYEVQLPVKAHKSAENVIRLLRKKQRAQGRPPCVFIVSWANAGALLPFLHEFQHVSAKVVLLCDARGGRRQDGSEEMFHQYPFVEKVASNWAEAVHAAGKAVAEFQVAQW